MVNNLAEFTWYLEIDDLGKAQETWRKLSADDFKAFNIACQALYSAAAFAGMSPYAFLIKERETYGCIQEELDYAAILECCQLWDKGRHHQAQDFSDTFELRTTKILEHFFRQVNITKPLVPQLTILRGN